MYNFAFKFLPHIQCAKKCLPNSPGLVDLIIHLPDGQVKVFGGIFGGNYYCAYKDFFWASENDCPTSTSWLQLAH